MVHILFMSDILSQVIWQSVQYNEIYFYVQKIFIKSPWDKENQQMTHLHIHRRLVNNCGIHAKLPVVNGLKMSVERRLLDVHDAELILCYIWKFCRSTTYRIFKQNLRFEKYLTDLRQAASRFNTLPRFTLPLIGDLPIVAGRYSNTSSRSGEPIFLGLISAISRITWRAEFHYWLFDDVLFSQTDSRICL